MNRLNRIIVLIGISGSGKSTEARRIYTEDYGHDCIIVNRDKIRELLYGYTEESIPQYYKLPNLFLKEKEVTKYQDIVIERALADNKIVIIDNTHLKLKYINELKTKYSDCIIEFRLIECDLQEAINRDSKRTRKVGKEVIESQFNDLKQLKKIFEFKCHSPNFKIICQDTSLPKAIIFDIDGTLAHMVDRGPFDWKKVGQDSINQPIVEIIRTVHRDNSFRIILCSGRDEICKLETEQWAKENNIPYHEIYMRKEGDMRKDSIIKEEIWENLVKKYYIVTMFDDRNQVVNHARKLGFSVCQVAEGDF